MRTLLLCLATPVLAALVLSSCGGTPNRSQPTVTIEAPAEGSQFHEGDDVMVRSSLKDPAGIATAELFIDGANARTDSVSSQPGGDPVSVVQLWKATEGVHVLGVRAYNRAGLVSQLATVTIMVVPGPSAAISTATPTPATAGPATATRAAPNPSASTPAAAASATSNASPQPDHSPAPSNNLAGPCTADLSPFQRAVKATAFIETDDDSGKWAYTGSGSVVDPAGLILTNYHVVRDYDSGAMLNSKDLAFVGFAAAPDQEPTRFYRVKAVALDHELDLAVIKIVATEAGGTLPPELGLCVVPLGNSDSVQIGDRIQFIGYPGLGGSTVTVTAGVVSGYLLNGAWFKTDTEINPGNSGGLAINAVGELIGVPSRHLSDIESVGKIGLFRPINPAKALIDRARWLSSVSSFEPTSSTVLRPATAPPSQTAPPQGVPPGMYATGLQVDPPQPKDGDYPTFKVTFLNNLGQTVYYNWYVKLYEPDKRNSFGETAKLNSTFPPGTTSLRSQANWKAPGAQPCRPFIARVFYQAPDGTIVEFPKPGGDPVQTYFTVCQ